MGVHVRHGNGERGHFELHGRKVFNDLQKAVTQLHAKVAPYGEALGSEYQVHTDDAGCP